MFILNSNSIKNVVLVERDNGDFISSNGFPVLGIDKDGHYIFKNTKKVLKFLKENNICFKKG